MNYIELINQFWRLNEEHSFTCNEVALYFYLLNTSNKLGWKNPFNQSNGYIINALNISEPTLIRVRNNLKQYGLIDFKSDRGRKNITLYTLNYLNSFSIPVSIGVSIPSSIPVSIPIGNALDNIKPKLKETKSSVLGAESLQTKRKEDEPPPIAPPPPNGEQFYLIPKMNEIWLKYNPDYPKDRDRDFEPLLALANFIAKIKSIPFDLADAEAVKTILLGWVQVSKYICKHDFFKSYSLGQVEKHIQTILQSMKNGKSRNETPQQGLQPGGIVVPTGDRPFGKL